MSVGDTPSTWAGHGHIETKNHFEISSKKLNQINKLHFVVKAKRIIIFSLPSDFGHNTTLPLVMSTFLVSMKSYSQMSINFSINRCTCGFRFHWRLKTARFLFCYRFMSCRGCRFHFSSSCNRMQTKCHLKAFRWRLACASFNRNTVN